MAALVGASLSTASRAITAHLAQPPANDGGKALVRTRAGGHLSAIGYEIITRALQRAGDARTIAAVPDPANAAVKALMGDDAANARTEELRAFLEHGANVLEGLLDEHDVDLHEQLQAARGF